MIGIFERISKYIDSCYETIIHGKSATNTFNYEREQNDWGKHGGEKFLLLQLHILSRRKT